VRRPRVEAGVGAGLAGGGGLIWRELIAVVERQRLVLRDAALLHIDEHRKRSEAIREVVAERHLIRGTRVTHVADDEISILVDRCLTDDLIDRSPRLEEELAVGEAEPR